MVYEFVKQLAIAVSVIGIALLLSHLARQISVGSASGWTLIAGIVLPIVSLLFWMIADIGSRLAADREGHSDGP